jgi:uncharacterized protein YsxB (DUF464 family)
MIKITFRPKHYDIKITGHAKHGKVGEDIVCSAVSILFYTLAESVTESRNMLKAEPIIENDDGNGHIQCVPKEEYEGNIARTYWTILNGFNLLATNYKKNVKLVIKGA